MNRDWLLGHVRGVLDLILGGVRGYLTEGEVSARTGAPPEKLGEWERRGLLRPYARTGQRLYRPEQLDVVRWLLREERIRMRKHLPPPEEAPGSADRWTLPAASREIAPATRVTAGRTAGPQARSAPGRYGIPPG